ncbi:MAG: hypothetical protein ACXVR9_08070 [Gaiellaceae bacterium]
MFRPKHAALLATATTLALGGTGVAIAASGGSSSSKSSGAATTATTTTPQSSSSHCDHDNGTTSNDT